MFKRWFCSKVIETFLRKCFETEIILDFRGGKKKERNNNIKNTKPKAMMVQVENQSLNSRYAYNYFNTCLISK